MCFQNLLTYHAMRGMIKEIRRIGGNKDDDSKHKQKNIDGRFEKRKA